MKPARSQRKPIIGIAGGIGSGKSAAAQILARLGCLVADADALARQALGDPAIRAELVRWWGDRALDEAGQIDRRAVASIVFADPEQRRRLENLTHPWIEAQRQAMFAAAGPETVAFVIDAPLLYEAGLDGVCDAVIFVEADRPTRLARLASQRGWSEAETARREESQLALDEKRHRADYVVRNEGDLSQLESQLRPILTQLISPQRSRRG